MLNETAAIATAADYADALMTARRAKNCFVLVLLLLLLTQLTIFFVARYTDGIVPVDAASAIASASPATLPTTVPARAPLGDRAVAVLHYLSGAALFLGLIFSIVLALTIYLIAKIMIVGRLIGVARLTGAFIWCIILFLLLFPWQAFMNNAAFTMTELKIPGVLYTWTELQHYAKFSTDMSSQQLAPAILHWSRFVAFPLITIIILLVVQVKSNRGLKQALGEADFIDPNAGVPQM